MKQLTGCILTLVLSVAAFAAEPNYCEPKVFFSKEVKFKNNLSNAHSFRLGEVLLTGLAVGNTRAQDLIAFGQAQAGVQAADKYCSWYFNEGNTDAEKNFTHIYLNNPTGLNLSSGPKEYGTKLKDQFAHNLISFLSCAVDHKYISLGCNGQKHRGPTVFGMLLAFSGCEPQKAATIVNTLWGLNGVPEAVRAAIISEGKRLGDLDPEARMRLQQAFGSL